MKIKNIIIILILFLSFNTAIIAEEKLSGQNSSSQNVYKLLQVLNMPEATRQMEKDAVNQVFDSLKKLPCFNLAFKKEITDFFHKILDYKEIEKLYAIIYTNYFNESEIDEIINFYSTAVGKKTLEKINLTADEEKELMKFQDSEVGKKIIAKSPELINKAKDVGYQIMESNNTELRAIMGKYIKEGKCLNK